METLNPGVLSLMATLPIAQEMVAFSLRWEHSIETDSVLFSTTVEGFMVTWPQVAVHREIVN